jgi:hypothetical protein
VSLGHIPQDIPGFAGNSPRIPSIPSTEFDMPGIVVEPDSIKEVRIKGASIQGRLSVKLGNEELERGTTEDEHGMK